MSSCLPPSPAPTSHICPVCRYPLALTSVCNSTKREIWFELTLHYSLSTQLHPHLHWKGLRFSLLTQGPCEQAASATAAAQRVAATLVCGSLVPVSADLEGEKPGLPGQCITWGWESGRAGCPLTQCWLRLDTHSGPL